VRILPLVTAGSLVVTALGVVGTTPVDLPDPASVGYGFDVNPSADRVRVVAGSLNFTVHASHGHDVAPGNGAAEAAGPPDDPDLRRRAVRAAGCGPDDAADAGAAEVPPPSGTGPTQLVGFSDPTTHIAKNCDPPP
jgi:hypothetical protein